MTDWSGFDYPPYRLSESFYIRIALDALQLIMTAKSPYFAPETTISLLGGKYYGQITLWLGVSPAMAACVTDKLRETILLNC